MICQLIYQKKQVLGYSDKKGKNFFFKFIITIHKPIESPCRVDGKFVARSDFLPKNTKKIL